MRSRSLIAASHRLAATDSRKARKDRAQAALPIIGPADRRPAALARARGRWGTVMAQVGAGGLIRPWRRGSLSACVWPPQRWSGRDRRAKTRHPAHAGRHFARLGQNFHKTPAFARAGLRL